MFDEDRKSNNLDNYRICDKNYYVDVGVIIKVFYIV